METSVCNLKQLLFVSLLFIFPKSLIIKLIFFMLMKWYLLDFFPWHCYKVFTIFPQIFYLIKFQCNIISLKTEK